MYYVPILHTSYCNVCIIFRVTRQVITTYELRYQAQQELFEFMNFVPCQQKIYL